MRKNLTYGFLTLLFIMSAAIACGGDDAEENAEVATTVDEAKTRCGDATCNGTETCSSCPRDCGACPSCGDGACNGSETCSTCSADCGACAPVCGDGTCNGTETCSSCSGDCGACPYCGDAICNGGETCSTCSGDCGGCPSCGGTCTNTFYVGNPPPSNVNCGNLNGNTCESMGGVMVSCENSCLDNPTCPPSDPWYVILVCEFPANCAYADVCPSLCLDCCIGDPLCF